MNTSSSATAYVSVFPVSCVVHLLNILNIAEVDSKHIAYQLCDALAVRGCSFYVTSCLHSVLFRASVYTLQGHHPSRLKA